MKYARRGNEYLRIEDSAADSYKKGGYDILDEKGEKVIEKAVKDNYTVAEYNALEKKLKDDFDALQAKYDKLQVEYNALEKKLKDKPNKPGKDDKPEGGEADKT